MQLELVDVAQKLDIRVSSQLARAEAVAREVCDDLLIVSHRLDQKQPQSSVIGQIENSPRFIGFDLYDTLMSSSALEHGHEGTGAPQEVALSEALQYAQINTHLFPAEALRQFKDAEREQKRSFRSSGAEIFPEMNAIAIWKDVFGISDDQATRLATAYELKRSEYGLMPGIAAFLNEALEREIPLGIISNAQAYSPAIFSRLMELSGLGNFSDVFPHEQLNLFSHRVHLGGRAIMKPTAALFERLVSEAQGLDPQIAPENSLYIGNCTRNDGAALGSGLQFALCTADPAKVRRERPLDPSTYVEFSHYADLGNSLFRGR